MCSSACWTREQANIHRGISTLLTSAHDYTCTSLWLWSSLVNTKLDLPRQRFSLLFLWASCPAANLIQVIKRIIKQPYIDRFIWLRCVGEGKHIKHAGQRGKNTAPRLNFAQYNIANKPFTSQWCMCQGCYWINRISLVPRSDPMLWKYVASVWTPN